MATSCKQAPSTAATAFYYWKSSFEPDSAQLRLLKKAGGRLYLRFFDVSWNDQRKAAYPDAIIHFGSRPAGLKVTPVIFIRNAVFEQLDDTGVDSLVKNTHKLLLRLAGAQRLCYQVVQFDCDWTLTTRGRYFKFLEDFKKVSGKQLEATIRLHQVKYRERTGVPPVATGILMFYNMGKITAQTDGENSIYNYTSADKYLDRLERYPLPLDVALPAFSWSVHSRNGKVTGLPVSISRKELENPAYFTPIAKAFRAKNSFFRAGIYIKQNDIFKPEEVTGELLQKAARQLSAHLGLRPQRTIIYYELANLNTLQFDDLEQATAHF